MTVPRHPFPHVRRVASAAVLAASVGLVVVPALPARLGGRPTAEASTSVSSMRADLLGRVNKARTARGLRKLRLWGSLDDVAQYRAGRMAASGVMSHTIGGSLTDELAAHGVHWTSYGEDIGWTTASWGSTAVSTLYSLWKASPEHWAILMSSRLNYIGIGFARRSANHATYASVVETESADHTAPARSISNKWRSGTTIGWSWVAHDILLQTHTAGLRNFDVEYRRDGGSWVHAGFGTTIRSLTLGGRAHGHTYELAVRARDNRGNTSHWLHSSIYVP